MSHLKQIGDHHCGPHCACRQVDTGKPRPEILPADTPDRRGEVATLVHDFGNLLQVATSALGQIERSFDPARDAALCALSQAGTAALLRAGVLSRALFEQRAGIAPEPILPSRVLAAIAPLLALAAGPLIEVGFEIPDDAPPVACEIHEFENAVLTLVTNARNAMPGGGMLYLTLTRRNETMLLRVTDNGSGMSAATLAFAFAPGFTTRQAAGGRGLGLAAVRHFAERNGGWVEIDTTPGKGTAITIGLPGAAVAYPHSNGDQG